MAVLAWTSPLAHIRELSAADFKSLGVEHKKVVVDRRDPKTKGQYEFPDDVAEALLENDSGWVKVEEDDVVISTKESADDGDDSEDTEEDTPPTPPGF